MQNSQLSARVVVGRLTDGDVTVFGRGLLVSPTIVMVPLSLSGSLRPRQGVVVLTERGADPLTACQVIRIARSESQAGDVLGLVLDSPLQMCEDPPTTGVDTWLQARLRGHDLDQVPDQTEENGARGPKRVPPPCVIFPPLCR